LLSIHAHMSVGTSAAYTQELPGTKNSSHSYAFGKQPGMISVPVLVGMTDVNVK